MSSACKELTNWLNVASGKLVFIKVCSDTGCTLRPPRTLDLAHCLIEIPLKTGQDHLNCGLGQCFHDRHGDPLCVNLCSPSYSLDERCGCFRPGIDRH